ncbi:MAG: hypothetical protein ACLPUO_26175 [Streptosporangiaceae bacterium]
MDSDSAHPGGRMRHASSPGMRRCLLLPAAALILAGLTAGCSSSKPAYCTAASQLKTSVQNLGQVDVTKNGLGSLETALKSVSTNAKTFATEAKSAFAPQTTALQNSISSLDTAVNSAKGQPSLAAAGAVASSVTQVKNAASNLENAASGKCQ